MDLVFQLRRAHLRARQRRAVRGGHAEEIARDPRVRAVYLGEAAAMADLLHAARLSRRLRRGRGAVAASTSRSPTGESLALLGRNGTGKTTLINTIVGLTRHRGGTIALAGRDITAPAARAARAAGIGWVPQERNIFRSLTVEENLTAVARPGPGRWRASSTCFRACASGAATSATSSPAASSRCWRSAARWCSTRADAARRAAGRARADHRRGAPGGAEAHHPRRGHARAIIVEQSAQKILRASPISAVILDRGTIVHAGTERLAHRRSGAPSNSISASPAGRRPAARCAH